MFRSSAESIAQSHVHTLATYLVCVLLGCSPSAAMAPQRSFPTSLGFANTALRRRAQWHRTCGSSAVCSRPTWQRLAQLGVPRQHRPVQRNRPRVPRRLRVYNLASPSDGAQRPEWIGQHALDAEPTLAACLLGQDRDPFRTEERSLGDFAAEALGELRNTSEASFEKTLRETDSEARTFEASFQEQLAHETQEAVTQLVHLHETAAETAWSRMQQAFERIIEERGHIRALIHDQDTLSARARSILGFLSKSRRLRWLVAAMTVTTLAFIYVAVEMVHGRDQNSVMVWVMLAVGGMIVASQRASD